MKHETFDGRPCSGTCVQLADAGVETRARLTRMQDEQLVLLKVAEHARTDAKYWQEQYEKCNARYVALSSRVVRGQGLLIEELGSVGPEGVDETLRRAVIALVGRDKCIKFLEEQVAELGAKLQKRIVLVWRCPECNGPCDVAWGRWFCVSSRCKADGPMPPEVVDARDEGAR